MTWISVYGAQGPVKKAYVHRDPKGSNPFIILYYSILTGYLTVISCQTLSLPTCNQMFCVCSALPVALCYKSSFWLVFQTTLLMIFLSSVDKDSYHPLPLTPTAMTQLTVAQCVEKSHFFFEPKGICMSQLLHRINIIR